MRIRWTNRAVRDFTRIWDYIEQHSSAATAQRVAHSIHERVDMLGKFPEFGRTGREPDTRELVFSGLPYVAIYRLRGE